MEIRVGSYAAATLLLEQEPARWHALVILDSGKSPTKFLDEHARSHQYLQFDDVEVPQSNKLSPTAAQVEKGLRFAKGKDKLLVSCRAGRGRRVAMAYLISCRERGAAEALKLLDPTRHHPNRLVVTLGEAFLESPDILDQFDDWRGRHVHIHLPDYYDEMEREIDALEAQGAVNRICGP